MTLSQSCDGEKGPQRQGGQGQEVNQQVRVRSVGLTARCGYDRAGDILLQQRGHGPKALA